MLVTAKLNWPKLAQNNTFSDFSQIWLITFPSFPGYSQRLIVASFCRFRIFDKNMFRPKIGEKWPKLAKNHTFSDFSQIWLITFPSFPGYSQRLIVSSFCRFQTFEKNVSAKNWGKLAQIWPNFLLTYYLLSIYLYLSPSISIYFYLSLSISHLYYCESYFQVAFFQSASYLCYIKSQLWHF